MKNLLVPVALHDAMPAVLETAWLVAQRFGSYLEGFALRRVVAEYVPVDMVGGVTWPNNDALTPEDLARIRSSFDSFLQSRGATRADRGSGVTYGWLPDAPGGDAFVGSHARVFDATVVARPLAGKAEPSMSTLEAALFESGRPLVIAPPSPPRSLGETVVIAWNGSTETARTTALAMPFLRQARRVVVLTVESGMVPGPSGDQLVRSLVRNDIPAEALITRSERRSAGESILDMAASLDADLLVKGAYTQSRIRQMIFGGATSHILAQAELPVFMAH